MCGLSRFLTLGRRVCPGGGGEGAVPTNRGFGCGRSKAEAIRRIGTERLSAHPAGRGFDVSTSDLPDVQGGPGARCKAPGPPLKRPFRGQHPVHRHVEDRSQRPARGRQERRAHPKPVRSGCLSLRVAPWMKREGRSSCQLRAMGSSGRRPHKVPTRQRRRGHPVRRGSPRRRARFVRRCPGPQQSRQTCTRRSSVPPWRPLPVHRSVNLFVARFSVSLSYPAYAAFWNPIAWRHMLLCRVWGGGLLADWADRHLPWAVAGSGSCSVE
jgi:hypothetical protein